MVSEEGLVRNDGICKHEKCFEKPLFMPHYNILIVHKVFADDYGEDIDVHQMIRCHSGVMNDDTWKD